MLEELERTKNMKSHFFTPSWNLLAVLRFMWLAFSIQFRSRKKTRVVIQRVHSNRFYARILKLIVRLNKSICYYDLDDAQYVECDPRTIHWFLEHSEGVFVGSRALQDYCSEFNDNVLLVTSATTNHVFQKTGRNKVLTVGWIGNFWGQHERNMFELFLPSLKSIEIPIKLEILGVVHGEKEEKLHRFFENYSNIELSIPKEVNWQNDGAIYQMISNYDIGVSPLLDTEINRCKSAYKLKQYLSCGVPVLGSKIGENARFIEDGKTGFICSSLNEFTQRIVEFERMSDEQFDTFSTNAFDSKKSFNISKVANDFYSILENAN